VASFVSHVGQRLTCDGVCHNLQWILVTTEQFFLSKSNSNNYARNWFTYLTIQMFVDLSKVHLLTNLIHNMNSFQINSLFIKMLLIIVWLTSLVPKNFWCDQHTMESWNKIMIQI